MTRYFIGFSVLALLLLGCATDDQWATGRDVYPADRPPASQRQAISTVAGNPDAFFLMQASHINEAEIQLSRIAVDRASDPQVRSYAQMMIDDHAELEDRLQELAQQMNMTLPQRPAWARQMPQSHLQSLSGFAFDEEYINMMIADHARAVAIFATKLEQTSDSTIRNFVQEGLPILQQHLDEARTLRTTLMGAGESGQ